MTMRYFDFAGSINARLGKQKYMLGDTYTIVDMNVWDGHALFPPYSAMAPGKNFRI
jgi:hypothetical protein